MPRKPNYAFERMERDRAKAQKLAEKAAIKREQREQERAASGETGESETPPADEDEARQSGLGKSAKRFSARNPL